MPDHYDAIEIHAPAEREGELFSRSKPPHSSRPRLWPWWFVRAMFTSPRPIFELDAINPQVASRLARALDRWRLLAEPYRSAAREAIARVAAKTDLSPDVREVVDRALKD